MTVDSWFPVGFELPDGATVRRALYGEQDWQIFETVGDGRALVADEELAERWSRAGLLHDSAMQALRLGKKTRQVVSCGSGHQLSPITAAVGPETVDDARSFAIALAYTRSIDPDAPLQDGIYVEKFSRILPTYGITSRTDDDVVFGFWLTGGVNVSVRSFRRLHQLMSWCPAGALKQVVEAGGYPVHVLVPGETKVAPAPGPSRAAPVDESAEVSDSPSVAKSQFDLPGRPELAAFFNEHVVDILRDRQRYAALGIGFPAAIILQGPPGTGKTFAVERLTEFLGWPSFSIDASSVASPYIHDTSRKIAQVFDTAIENAPSVLIIDEMDAFLSDRNASSGHHRVEEVAEFLRRIPEANKHDVLVIAMTNRIDLIDDAVLRRGRFDHILEVGYAGEVEVKALLENLLGKIPIEPDIDVAATAKRLANRPLSDVTFVVREAARLATRAGKNALDAQSLATALQTTPSRFTSSDDRRRVGFV